MEAMGKLASKPESTVVLNVLINYQHPTSRQLLLVLLSQLIDVAPF